MRDHSRRRVGAMPLYSDYSNYNTYYSGTPSYSSASPYTSYGSSSTPLGTSFSASYLTPGGNYSNHSSLGGYSRTPFSPRWIPSSGRTYSPILSTISERGTSSPVRISSPRRIPITKSYATTSYTSRPININTADIDVSRDRYKFKANDFITNNERTSRNETSHNNLTQNDPFMPRVDGKPETGVDSSPGSQRSTIKRGRTVVRLHTVKRRERDSPRKPQQPEDLQPYNDNKQEPKDESEENTDKETGTSWRERLSEDLQYKDKREKKTIGEKLIEKFKLKDDNCDPIISTLPIQTDSLNTDTTTIKDNKLIDNIPTCHSNRSPDRRCSMELLAEQANLLDSMIRSENLSTATLDLSKVGIHEDSTGKVNQIQSIKRKKISNSENNLQTTKSDHSLHDRVKSLTTGKEKQFSKRRSLKKSSSGGSICRLDSITELTKEPLQFQLPAIEESRISIKNEQPKTKPKQKPIITSTVEVSQPTNAIKFRVDNVTVEEKVHEPKKGISFCAVVEPEVSNNDGYNKVKVTTKSDVESDDNESENNFWDKIGKRETIYLNRRKEKIQDDIIQKRRAMFWYQNEDESETSEGVMKSDYLNSSQAEIKTDDSTSIKDANTTIITKELDKHVSCENVDENNQSNSIINLNNSDTEKDMTMEKPIETQTQNNDLPLNTDIKYINEVNYIGNQEKLHNSVKKPDNDITERINKKQSHNSIKMLDAQQYHTKQEEECVSKTDNVPPMHLIMTSKKESNEKTNKIEKVKTDANINFNENTTTNKNMKEIQAISLKTNIKHNSMEKLCDKIQKSLKSDNECNNNLQTDIQQEQSNSTILPENINIIVKTQEKLKEEIVDSSYSIDEKNLVKIDANDPCDKLISNNDTQNLKEQVNDIVQIESENIPNKIEETSTEKLRESFAESKTDNIGEENKAECNVPITSIKEEDEVKKTSSKGVIKLPVSSTKKPVKDEPALRPLIATPRPLQKKVPQVIHSSSSDSSSDEDSSDEEDADESDASADSSEFFECENNPDGRTSTGSNDSGFDSSAPTSPAGFVFVKKDCDVNCHRKCEKLTANLCGVNQRLLVEALASQTASKRGGGDSSAASTSAPTAATPQPTNVTDIQEHELEASTAYGLFRKTGRFTPPARSIPRFRKYNVEDFHFIKVLGKGSFGKVLLAELRDTEYYYAVKCLKKDVVLEDDDVECTLIERKVLALGTNHPYLCHLFATFQTDSHLFFVMEYLNGGDLMFHIQQSGRFPEVRARFYAAEIVSGLKFLHKRGIVYRDLKLDNILLDFDGHVRIADFGMCKLQIYLDKTADTFCGTPDYMAPEIIKGLKYSQTVDWWSFGVLLYEMLIGQSPFSGCDEDELFWSICNEMPSYPRFLSPESLTILTRLLDKDARTRLGSTECMHGDVRDQDFFHAIHWDRLERRELESPFKPRVRHPLDTQYFDRAFTGERPRLTAVEPQVLRSMDQEPFRGFSYTNPNATDR